MKTRIEDRPSEDEFAPIELGSVSEETKGILQEGSELDVTNNSRAFA